ncbi:hypothetical protein ACQ4M3_03030 [Leptolyngbya sp. AN03gr2]|uniref:hypothetical protein n=1 Tax=unclassified Leptolyngbya TaxID=2650499 RepID=UPI003D319EBD
MKQSFKVDRLLTLSIALLTVSTSLVPYIKKADANPAVAAPLLCSTGVGCIFVGVATIGGIVYYVWQNQATGVRHYDNLEDPEDHDEWGIFSAKSEWHCHRLAAGRDHWFDHTRKQCHIKG